MTKLHFLTDLPSFAGKHFLPQWMEREPDASFVLLVPPNRAEPRHLLDFLDEGERERIEFWEGDAHHLHMGLSSAECRRLRDEVTHVHHLSGELRAVKRGDVRRHLDAAENVLELCREAPHLERLSHLSTLRVAGDRHGVLHEEELSVGQRFQNLADEAAFQVERLIQRARSELPITVLRPAPVIGDSRTGELARKDLPFRLVFRLAIPPFPIPLQPPGARPVPFQVVPSDYVAQAIVELSADEAAEGRTFHLVDPRPMSAKRVWEEVTRRMGGTSSWLELGALLGAPLVRLLFGEGGGALGRSLVYTYRNTLEHLDAKGVSCPPLPSYLDRLIGWAERQAEREADPSRSRHRDAEDPLDVSSFPGSWG